MLTKQDLTDVSKLLKNEFKIQLQPIYNKLIEHDNNFEKINQKFDKVDKKLSDIQQQLVKNNKNHATMIEYFDNNDIKHRERFDRIESQLGLSHN